MIQEQDLSQRIRRPRKMILLIVPFLLLALWLLFALTTTFLNSPPSSFPVDSTFVIENGMSTRLAAKALKEQGMIRSEWYFYTTVILFYDPRNIKASTYYFSEPLRTNEIIEQLLTGDFDNDLVRVTFPEGIPALEMVDILESADLVDFDSELFLTLAQPVEGTLFPDTFFVPPNFSAADWFELLTQQHRTVMSDLRGKYEQALSDEEIIILASIIEREANSEESMRMVSGILQNRLEIGMPLQADATMEYVLEKPLAELVPSDLEIDTPYNTYLYTGLPPTPIGNPGRTALEAVFNPIESENFFYITGNDGNFYYAETFDEHRRNIARYLR